jgi:hypothetical protein
MGTNYFAIPKLDKGEKATLIKAIEEDNVLEARKIMPVEVHIGKSSMGWKFLFNHNDWDYFKDEVELIQWLAHCDIRTEYGTPVEYGEFIKMVSSKQSENQPIKNDSSGWYKWKGEYCFSTSTEFS